MFKATSYGCIEANIKVKLNRYNSSEYESMTITGFLVQRYRLFFVRDSLFFVLVDIVDGLVYIEYCFWYGKKIKLAMNE